MEYEPPRDWWGVWENAAAVAFKNGRLRIEAPVRLSHAESWREGAVIHCKGTISGKVNGKRGNAPEIHGTRNGTHRDVGKVDMCVLNPAPRNPGWKWGRGGCFNWYQSQRFRHRSFFPYGSVGPVVVSVEREFEQLRVFGRDQNNKNQSLRSRSEQQKVPSTELGGNASMDSSNNSKVETKGDMEAGKKERARQGVALRFGKITLE
uniref:Uncharacterized protein n=1 Tax=Brassica oleracea var. oleracea TaxID=109376 RepID=A0A0D3BDU5_BRAOL